MEKPFSLTMARLNNVNGKLSKNFPVKASRIAKPINPKKITFLVIFVIFLKDAFAIDFNKK